MPFRGPEHRGALIVGKIRTIANLFSAIVNMYHAVPGLNDSGFSRSRFDSLLCGLGRGWPFMGYNGEAVSTDRNRNSPMPWEGLLDPVWGPLQE
jgi:hypothetical protein